MSVVRGDTNRPAISGSATVGSVGAVKGNGKAEFKDNLVDILFADVDLTEKSKTTTERALTGVTFKTSTEGSGNKCKITGYTYFRDGSKLSDLDKPGSVDKVELTDGKVLSGTISHVTRDEVSIVLAGGGSETVRVSDINEIQSPRVFTFEMNVTGEGPIDPAGSFMATTTSVKFVGTHHGSVATKQSEPSRTGTRVELSKGKKIAILVLGLAVIATAIAVPIAVAVGTRGRGNNSQQELANFLLARNLMSRSTPAPVEPPVVP